MSETPRLDAVMRVADAKNTPPYERPHLLFALCRSIERRLRRAVRWAWGYRHQMKRWHYSWQIEHNAYVDVMRERDAARQALREACDRWDGMYLQPDAERWRKEGLGEA